MLAVVLLHLFCSALALPVQNDVENATLSSSEPDLSEALPFPHNSRFNLKPYEAPGQPPARFDVMAVYMACAFGLFNQSLVQAQVHDRSMNHFYDLSSEVNSGPDIFIITQMTPPVTSTVLVIWTLEGIMQRLKRFRKTLPRMSFELHMQPRGPMESFGSIGSVTQQPALVERPDFSDVVVTPKPGAQPVDFRDTFLTSIKVFKRVGGIANKDDVVTMNRNFAVGGVEMNFWTWPGQPRLLTWREVSRAAMAMLQSEKANGEQFREVRAIVFRDGVSVGHAEIVSKGSQVAMPVEVE